MIKHPVFISIMVILQSIIICFLIALSISYDDKKQKEKVLKVENCLKDNDIFLKKIYWGDKFSHGSYFSKLNKKDMYKAEFIQRNGKEIPIEEICNY